MPGCAGRNVSSDTSVEEENCDFDATSCKYISEGIECGREWNGPVKKNPNNSLSVPTQVSYYDGLFFIVDCYNNQVIYSDKMGTKLSDWNVMTDNVSWPHTMCTDGVVYLVDDTENNRVLVLEKEKDENNKVSFKTVTYFVDIGNRPHYSLYDEKTKSFFIWSSQSGEMFIFKRDINTNRVYYTDKMVIPELSQSYVRSFSIIDGDFVFVSGNSEILITNAKDLSIKKRISVPETMAGMVQITKVDGLYFITVSTDIYGNQEYANIFVCEKLEDLGLGEYTSIKKFFSKEGTPYYMNYVKDKWFLTYHKYSGVDNLYSFTIDKDQISGVEGLY